MSFINYSKEKMKTLINCSLLIVDLGLWNTELGYSHIQNLLLRYRVHKWGRAYISLIKPWQYQPTPTKLPYKIVPLQVYSTSQNIFCVAVLINATIDYNQNWSLANGDSPYRVAFFYR